MSKTLTKEGLVVAIRDKNNCSQLEASDYLETVLEIMKSSLEGGNDLKVSGFGKFELKQKADRCGRNPHTGEAITIKSRRVLTFKTSAALRNRMNK